MDMSGRRAIAVAFLAVLLVAACDQPGPGVQRVSMTLTGSSTGFGLRLTDRLLAEPGAGNVFISPLSATLALSMAASAAQGSSRASILAMLGLDPSVDPSSQAKQTIDRLIESDPNAQLELAQAVWAARGMTINPQYASRLRTDYRAQIASLDFTSPGAPKVVNDWVDNATHHKIPQLVDAFAPNTVAYLVNATYFHALWATEFKTAGSANFRTFGGTPVTIPMMHRSDGVTQVSTPDYSAALLPYKGGRFSMLLLLPRAVLSPAEFSRFLTRAVFDQSLTLLHGAVGELLGGNKCTDKSAGPDVSVSCDGGLVMPKFKLDYSAELLKELVAMGMAADAGMPDLCGPCSISRVVQKTHLEIDEKGTTAAAATGVVGATALRVPMTIDRPFALALIDNASDAPLFLGVIGQL
jgi:serpin B